MGKRLVLLIIAAILLLGLFSGAAKASNDSDTLMIGDQDEYVRTLQTRLKELGYFSSAPTGYFGIVTQQAVISYQQDHHLTVDGKAGPNTLQSILGTVPDADSANNLCTATYYPGDRGDAVAELQQRLASLEYYEYSNFTGYYGPVTEQAVKRFQRVNGIDASGIADPDTTSLLVSGHAAYLCLYPGDHDQNVERLQKRLSELGYFDGSGHRLF